MLLPRRMSVLGPLFPAILYIKSKSQLVLHARRMKDRPEGPGNPAGLTNDFPDIFLCDPEPEENSVVSHLRCQRHRVHLIYQQTGEDQEGGLDLRYGSLYARVRHAGIVARSQRCCDQPPSLTSNCACVLLPIAAIAAANIMFSRI